MLAPAYAGCSIAGMGWMVVTAEVADDPVKLAELREQLLRMVEEGGLPE